MTTAPGSVRLTESGHRWSVVVDLLGSLWRCVGIAALWMLACLPVVSAGAATVALFAVVRDDVLRQQRPVVRSFLGHLRSNAALGTGLLLLVGGPIGGLVVLTRIGTTTPIGAGLWALALVGTIAIAPILAHGFALAAHTHQTLRSLYRASVIMALTRPGATLISLGVTTAFLVATLWWPLAPVVLTYPAARALFLTFRGTFESLSTTDDSGT